MPATASRLTSPEFISLCRDGLTAEDAAEQRIILPKAYAAEAVTTEVKADDDGDEKRTSSWVISTATADRMGDTLQVKGWKLTNFRKGGSILYGHNRNGLPIAKPIKVWKEAGVSLNLNMLHTSDEENPLGKQIFALVKGGFLRSNSVGFQPIKWELIDEDDWWGGVNYLQQELVEDSIVPVPANPEALLQSVGKSMDMRLFTDWQRLALDGEVPSLGAHHDDIAASLKALTGNPVSVSVPAADAVSAAATNMRRHSIGLANSVSELEAGLGIGKLNPHLTDEFRESLERLAAPTEAAAQALADHGITGKSESADGAAATGLAASQPPAGDTAPPVDQKSADATPAELVSRAMDTLAAAAAGCGVDTKSTEQIEKAQAVLAEFAPAEETGAEQMDIAKQIDALAKAAKEGDADALEQLRSLAEHIATAAKDLSEPDPEDVSFFEFTDDEARAADDDLIEMSGADLAAEIAKAVAKEMAAHTGQN